MSGGHQGSSSSEENPLEILKRRLAKGEITLDEYDKLRSVLAESGSGEPTAMDAHHH